MGFKPSPYLAIRFLAIAIDLARGDPYDSSNPFHWSNVILNLPCSDTFNPSLPWVYKWNETARAISEDVVSFVDDFRIVGYLVENCWQCGRRIASRLQHRDVQDAARKRKPPSLTPGAWAGTVAHTNETVTKTVTQEKWLKAKILLKELRSEIGSKAKPGLMNHKRLEKARGFFNHLSLIYEIIVYYLRGFHNTINSWRDNRDVEKWRRENESSK